MFRLLRTMFGLLAVTAACIALVIATRTSDSAWDCLSIYGGTSVDPNRQLIDLFTGARITNQPYPVWDRNISATYNSDHLIYNYRSPNQTHRIGVVTTERQDAHHYLDFSEAGTSFTMQRVPSSDFAVIPITTFDPARQSQTVTLYTAATLTPIVSVTQSPVIVPSTRDEVGFFEVSWSPNDKSFWFPIATETQLSMMVLSAQTDKTVSLPLRGEGYPRNLRYMWSTAGHAVAISSGNMRYMNIFVAKDDAWENAQSFYIDGGADALAFLRWSLDEQTLYLHKFLNNRTSGSGVQTLAFSLKSQRLEEIEERQANEVLLHLNDQWFCDQSFSGAPASLVSVSGDHPPIPLATIPQNQGACTLLDDPTHTKLLVPMPSTASGEIQWALVSADPFEIKPLALPPNTLFMLMWLEGNAKVVFFTLDVEPMPENYLGHLGILDLASSQWQMLPYPIVIDNVMNYSPDRTRFTIAAADRQQAYLFSSAGQLLTTVAFSEASNLGNLWAADSARVVFISYNNADSRFVLATYDRDGRPLAKLRSRSYNASAYYKNVVRCEPLPKLPRLNLPQ